MDAGKSLLDNHKAVTLLFTLLEINTAQTVQFKEFSYIVGADKKIKLAMKGEARSYTAIAFQSDVFSKIEQLKNTMFTNLFIDEKGIITFDFSAEVDPSVVAYKKLFPDGASVMAPAPIDVTTPAPTLPNGTSTVPTTSTSTAPVSTGTTGTTTSGVLNPPQP